MLNSDFIDNLDNKNKSFYNFLISSGFEVTNARIDRNGIVNWQMIDVNGEKLNFNCSSGKGSADKIINLFLDFYESKMRNK